MIVLDAVEVRLVVHALGDVHGEVRRSRPDAVDSGMSSGAVKRTSTGKPM